MVQPKLNFRSISGEESLESQQKLALRDKFLPTKMSSNDKFNPKYDRKLLIGKRISILEGAF